MNWEKVEETPQDRYGEVCQICGDYIDADYGVICSECATTEDED